MSEAVELFRSDRIILRDILPTDVEAFLRWQTSGEWRYYDAPWEGIHEHLNEEEEEKFRQTFLENRSKPQENPRRLACICFPDGTPFGRLNRYGNQGFPGVFYIGISIFEDDYLEKGYGTIAFKSWVDYLFLNSDIHKIETHTWSLNPRMIRVADKLGFTHEGTERELINWEGKWQDRLRFGLLREEWEDICM